MVTGLLVDAHAQEGAETAAARTLGQEGVIAAKEGRCDEAIDKLTRAKKLIQAPTILVPLGECQIALGKIVAGTENLQAAARERLPDDAPKAFVDAQKRAREVLPDALKKLAKINLVIAAPSGVKLTVTDNGQPVSEALLGVDKPSDPGAHVITVSAPGYLTAKGEVTVNSGERAELKLKLEPDPNAPKDVPPDTKIDPPPGGGPGPEPLPPPKPAGSSPLVPAGGVALGLGGAGLILGGVFGGLASGKQGDLDEICVDKVCPDGASDDIDTMKSFAHVSTAGFVVGGVAAVLGATLLGIGLSQGSGGSESAHIEPLIGPGFFGVRGSF